LSADHLPVFDCAFKPHNGVRSIQWHAHVSMMAAAQPFLSGAISKTVNMPRESTPADIASAYLEGWKLGLKALAIYRDGSKESQPLNTASETDKAAAKQVAAPRRERLPDTRNSKTHKFNVAGHEGYITVGLYDDGRPGELFHHDGQGGKHHRRPDGLFWDGRLDEHAIRRAAGSVCEQVLAYPVRADGTHQEPGHPDRQEHRGLHLPLAGDHVLPGYREAQQSLMGDEGKGSAEDAIAELSPAAKKAGGPGKDTAGGQAKKSQPPAPQAAAASKPTAPVAKVAIKPGPATGPPPSQLRIGRCSSGPAWR